MARGNRPLIRASLPATMRNQLVGPAFSQPSSALNQVNNQYDDRDYEQEMDQAAANVAKEAKKPEHDQDDNYSPEHGIPFG